MRDFRNFSDEELVVLLYQSDEAAMSEIFHRYWRKLLDIAYNHTKDKHSAKEIVQTIMIRVWDRRGEQTIGKLNNYLSISVRYAVYNFIARNKRRTQIATENLPTNDVHLDDENIYAKFMQQYINTVVDELPEKCRLVFKYSRLEGKCIKQIAEQMDISEKTVEAHLTKALKTLRFSLRHAGWLTILVFFLTVKASF